MKKGIFRIAFLDCIRHSRSNLKIFALLTFVFVLLMTCLGYIFTLDYNIGVMLNEEKNREIVLSGGFYYNNVYPANPEEIAAMKHVVKTEKLATAFQRCNDDEITIDGVSYVFDYEIHIDYLEERQIGAFDRKIVGRTCKESNEFMAYSSALAAWGITDYEAAIGKSFDFYTLRTGEKLFQGKILTGVVDDGGKKGDEVNLIMPESEVYKLRPMSETNLIPFTIVVVTVDDYMRKDKIMAQLSEIYPKCFVEHAYNENSEALRNIRDHRKLMLGIFGVVGGLAAIGLLLCAGVAVFNDDNKNKWRYGAMMAQGLSQKDVYNISFFSRFLLVAAASVVGTAVSVPTVYAIKIVMGEMFGAGFALNAWIIFGAFSASFVSLAAVCALCVPALKVVLKNRSILSILKGR